MSLDQPSPSPRTAPHDRLASALEEDLAAVGAIIRERMQSEAAPRIPAVSAHLVEAGGKRLRPMLVLAAAGLLGGGGEAARRLAAVVEFIHTATLLHDDVVDASTQRRGRPTANLLWDNQSSVLVGDYLFARAFELMVEVGSLPVLGILARASATIAEGEVLQLSSARDLSTTEDTYLRIVRGKTAALFAAATETGALVAGADAAAAERMRRYGDALGIAFQIADDLLDIEGDAGIGKNRGDDLREGKLTLPVIRAIAAADEGERAFWRRVLGRAEVAEGDVDEARTLMRRHGTLASARAEADAWAARARDALDGLPDHPLREMLLDLADYVVTRAA
ncbi:polyprenyl synthetase family protein [Rubellimicrobium sp. CFH 75288]|uniref:polyprenyl synthetase family protein n=1 Tax=Rubellimicrobium sp. CFH 75288 TaxID=2697034 RepID=UPI001412B2C6|nr:polyprenyl synthetase family protein [Rubellimicrobium sp. CFH 75288]NAZ37645.1 polyprenyl synthetase family protein [Rubellimicrobium sp. CFH 75288]